MSGSLDIVLDEEVIVRVAYAVSQLGKTGNRLSLGFCARDYSKKSIITISFFEITRLYIAGLQRTRL